MSQNITLHVNPINSLVDGHANTSHGTSHGHLMAVAFIFRVHVWVHISNCDMIQHGMTWHDMD